MDFLLSQYVKHLFNYQTMFFILKKKKAITVDNFLKIFVSHSSENTRFNNRASVLDEAF